MSDTPEKKKGGCLRGIGALVIIVIIVAVIASVAGGGGGTKATTTKDRQASIDDDVTVKSCTPDAANYMTAEITVKNNSSKRSNYIITVAFESPDGSEQLDTGLAAINGLAAGQTSTETAQTLTEATDVYACKVTDVTRLSAEG